MLSKTKSVVVQADNPLSPTSQRDGNGQKGGDRRVILPEALEVAVTG
jgi:hypothetical protein